MANTEEEPVVFSSIVPPPEDLPAVGFSAGGGGKVVSADSPDLPIAESLPQQQPQLDETPEERQRRIDNEAQMRATLNQQTIILYRQYAIDQHPKEPHKQEELIRTLQEQHFNQYVTNVYQQQLIHQQQQIDQLTALMSKQSLETNGDVAGTEVASPKIGDSDLVPLELVPASLWTRKDMPEFKEEVLRTQKECCIKIGSLATATVRVPTHPEGSCIFWEFATDNYDLGFGIYFEWTVSPSDVITVHISESSDEEDLDEEKEEGETTSDPESPGIPGNDLERGAGRRGGELRPSTDELIPVYRRDCHEEVYCGSHQYPGRGVYVLKFDNSYSLWRSKWLYYRVYYTK